MSNGKAKHPRSLWTIEDRKTIERCLKAGWKKCSIEKKLGSGEGSVKHEMEYLKITGDLEYNAEKAHEFFTNRPHPTQQKEAELLKIRMPVIKKYINQGLSCTQIAEKTKYSVNYIYKIKKLLQEKENDNVDTINQ